MPAGSLRPCQATPGFASLKLVEIDLCDERQRESAVAGPLEARTPNILDPPPLPVLVLDQPQARVGTSGAHGPDVGRRDSEDSVERPVAPRSGGEETRSQRRPFQCTINDR